MSIAHDVCNEAAGYIGEYGHYKGSLEDPSGNGSVCAMGAIFKAVGLSTFYGGFNGGGDNPLNTRITARYLPTMSYPGSPLFAEMTGDQRRMAAADAIRLLVKENGITLPIGAWNDHPARSAEDVILAFKTAGHAGE